MKYVKLVIEIEDNYQESLISEMDNMDFNAFEQQDNRLVTYITKENFNVVHRERIEQLLNGYPGDNFIISEEVVADQNWNEQWEQTIQAQSIGEFFVKPTWDRQAAPKDKITLEIDPKMSFGTGYHNTTRLMLHLLPDIIEKDMQIIDAGTGTGILAIAAVKLGARHVFAFDIDDWSITNTKENILINEVADCITVKKGSTETISAGQRVDVILANIERNTILHLLPEFTKLLKEEGLLLISGLLVKDKPAVMNDLKDQYDIREVRNEDEWIAILAQKKN